MVARRQLVVVVVAIKSAAALTSRGRIAVSSKPHPKLTLVGFRVFNFQYVSF